MDRNGHTCSKSWANSQKFWEVALSQAGQGMCGCDALSWWVLTAKQGESQGHTCLQAVLWHVLPSHSTGTTSIFTPCPVLALSWWTGVMSLKVLEPESLKPRGLITAGAEALNTCPLQAGFVQATRVFSCPPAKVFGRRRHAAKGWSCSSGARGQGLEGSLWTCKAASGDFTSLTVVFLNIRGRKNSCGGSRGGCFQHGCPAFEGGHGEETWVALSPTQPQPT